VQDVDAGTGYHVPEGSLAIYAGSGYEAPDHSRRMIPADQLKAWLLEIIERDRIEIGAAH
jgi:hypothetical protein